MPDRLLHEGQLFGNYRLVRLVGRGGFADVYLARHIHIRRQAAIKLLHTQMDRGTVQRFKREAQIVADLHHPHIISLLDFGVHSEHIPYLVMEYAASGTLRQRHPRGTVLSPDQVLGYIAQIAEALDFAHRKSIIHRDVKPENMLLNEQDILLLSDFGIATLTSESGAQETPSVAGTTTYMAPEQLRGKTRPESDQYALAVVVYEWLCGTPPFQGSSTEIAVQHVTVSPPSLHARNPHIPLALEEVVNIALAKDPAQRYPSVTALVEEFRLALYPVRRDPNGFVKHAPTSHNPVPRRRQTMLGVPAQTQRPSKPASQRVPSYSTIQPSPVSVSRRTLVLAAGSLALLGGVGGLAWFARQNTHTTGGNTGAGVSGRATAGATRASKTPVPILTTLQIYNGHKDIVDTVAWSPDGNIIASGSRDGTAQLWNTITGQNILVYIQHKDIVSSVAWSSDAKYIVSGSFDKTMQIWDTKGNVLSTFNPQNKIVSSASWSPVASQLASVCLDSDEVDLFANPTSGTANINIFHHIHSNYTYAIAWSPDGTKIATASGGGTGASVQIWDIVNSSLITSFDGHTGSVLAITWSYDGKFVASGGSDKTVRIWDVNSPKEILTYQDHIDAVNTVAWCPTNPGLLASGSNDKTVRIWTNAGITLHKYDKHSDSVRSITWSPDGTRIASASADKTVLVWQAS